MIKDIVVHLTGSQEDEVRLAYAEAIGARFDAHLTGLYTHILPEVIGGDGVADLLDPFGKRPLFHGRGQRRHQDFGRHEGVSS